MLLSGYGHDEASEGGQHHLQFALEAWQREHERLCDEAAPTLTGEQQYKGSSLASTTKTGEAGETRSNDSCNLHELLCDEAPTLTGEQQFKCSSLANTTKTGEAGETRSNDSCKLHSYDQSCWPKPFLLFLL